MNFFLFGRKTVTVSFIFTAKFYRHLAEKKANHSRKLSGCSFALKAKYIRLYGHTVKIQLATNEYPTKRPTLRSCLVNTVLSPWGQQRPQVRAETTNPNEYLIGAMTIQTGAALV